MGELQQPESNAHLLMQKIQAFLLENYQPVQMPSQAELHYTTQDIYIRLQQFYPSEDYAVSDVAEWLFAAGFTFFEYADFRLEWLFKRRKTNSNHHEPTETNT